MKRNEEISAKQNRCPTSNERFNVPMTDEQWDVVDFIGLEAETTFVYPFAVDFDDATMEMVDRIVAGCNGHTNDRDTLYDACESVLGVNPSLKGCALNAATQVAEGRTV